MKSIRGKKAKGSDEPLTSATEYEAFDEMIEVKRVRAKNESE
jgi:hypothetical protein